MTADYDAGWARTVRAWHLAFYAMALISALALATTDLTSSELTVALGAMVVLVVAYTLLARPAALSRNARPLLAYLAILISVTVLVVRVHPLGSTLLFIAFSQIWFLTTSRRTGVLLTTLLTAGVWAAFVLRLQADQGLMLNLAAQMAASLGFSILLGLWIVQVTGQSHERAVLVGRLEAAQSELAAQHHAAGVAAERERFAQEIHDTLAQGFGSIVMLAQTATAHLDRGQDLAAHERVALIEQTARENLAEARALVAAFAPLALDGATLTEALGRLAHRFEAETAVVVELIVDASHAHWDRSTEVMLLRAAQEALANVRRHAHATHVVLRLDADGARTELRVDDDGRGITAGTPEGIGLGGMRERVRASGGALELSTLPEGGTRLWVSVPAAAAVTP